MNTLNRLYALTMLAALAGCTSDWDPDRKYHALIEAPHPAESVGRAAFRPSRAAAFASLPDRGELLAYDRNRNVRQRGALTSHPVKLSEAHAFRASHAGGELVVTAPNGEQIRLGYERHVEHPDGNWTWIGRARDGTDAVLTFGEKAVFGTIPYGDHEPLRVTTVAGGAWLMETDRSRMPEVSRATNRHGKPDYLVPPALAASLASSASTIAAASADEDVSAKASPSPIDVVLGYTNGYAAQVGGSSQAVTRLNNLVQISNQALANSLVSRRLRLVRTVQVTYADATSNTETLEQLTGYRSGTGSIPVPSALQPLRVARDEYGGDLVSLVRAFRAPENDGCGIAWLIGGGQSAYTVDSEPFAYSVVSDGSDEDEGDGNTYFCREESLAHEFGHNLGQAHSVEDSEQAGAHAYSYGYREASPTGFFTVMAYPIPDSSQFAIRYFANPAVNFSGRPTGVANASDNARSLNQTMPVAVNFRATVVPLPSGARRDINGDRKSDLLWRNATGRLSYWLMSGETIGYSSPSIAQTSAYLLKATGDFTGDGRGEIVWQSASNVVMWRNTGSSNNAAFSATVVAPKPAGWSIVGAGDIDGDGKNDLFWRNASSGNFSYWLMDGATIRSQLPSIAITPSYRLVAIGDFNGDGLADLVWDNNISVWMWLGNGSGGFTQRRVADHPAGWSIQGAGDISGDGKSELLWRNTASGQFSYWVMNSATVTSASPSVAVSPSYRLIGIGDLNGDGRTDLVWDNNSSIWAWFSPSSGTTFIYRRIGNHPSGWTGQDPLGS